MYIFDRLLSSEWMIVRPYSQIAAITSPLPEGTQSGTLLGPAQESVDPGTSQEIRLLQEYRISREINAADFPAPGNRFPRRLIGRNPPGETRKGQTKANPNRSDYGPPARGYRPVSVGIPRTWEPPEARPSCRAHGLRLRRRLLLRRWPETLQDAGPDTADKLMSAFGLSEGAGKLSPPFLRALGLLRSEETAPPFPPHFSTPSLWRRSESPPAPS